MREIRWLIVVKRTVKFRARQMAEQFQYYVNKFYPKTSAFSPLLVFDTIVLPPSIWTVSRTEIEVVRGFLLILIGVLVSLTFLVYVVLLIFKIDALRSEPFLLEMARKEGEPAKIVGSQQLSSKQE